MTAQDDHAEGLVERQRMRTEQHDERDARDEAERVQMHEESWVLRRRAQMEEGEDVYADPYGGGF